MARATLTIYARINDGPPYDLARLDIDQLRANVRPVVAELLRQMADAVEEA